MTDNMDEYLSKAEIIILFDERIRAYDEKFLIPKHVENQSVLKTLSLKIDNLTLDIAKMVAASSIVMKFAGAGIVIWAIRQLVELVQSFHK